MIPTDIVWHDELNRPGVVLQRVSRFCDMSLLEEKIEDDLCEMENRLKGNIFMVNETLEVLKSAQNRKRKKNN